MTGHRIQTLITQPFTCYCQWLYFTPCVSLKVYTQLSSTSFTLRSLLHNSDIREQKIEGTGVKHTQS